MMYIHLNLVTYTNVINEFTVPVGCVPPTHRLIGVIACLPLFIDNAGMGPVGREIMPY